MAFKEGFPCSHCELAQNLLLTKMLRSAVSNDVAFRLMPSSSGSDASSSNNVNMGRLQVNYNGVWGRVCGAGFGWNEALVACRNLGFESTLDITRR